jgi:hypothetical protein
MAARRRPCRASQLEHFPEKWSPVFRQKMRPLKKIGTLSDSIESESALVKAEAVSMALAGMPADAIPG